VTLDAEGTPTVLVVGGSLVGLSSAIALARSGATVTVLERTGSCWRASRCAARCGLFVDAFDGAGGRAPADILKRFQEQRLRPAQAHVEHSVTASAGYMLRSR
jgi:2-polyprenyl-6-methoxyphenol hydroxylase-like FAD-dependent oxidoreductase